MEDEEANRVLAHLIKISEHYFADNSKYYHLNMCSCCMLSITKGKLLLKPHSDIDVLVLADKIP